MTKLKSRPHIFITAFIVGSVLAVAVSVWATSVGTDISVTGKLTVSGTTGTTTIASGQGFTVGSSQFLVQQTSGNVGIGTTGPAVNLEVSSLVSNPAIRVTAVGGRFAQLQVLSGSDQTPSTVYQWIIGTQNNFAGNVLLFRSRLGDGTTDSTTGDRMVIQPTGNVGIGTTSPFALLSVNAPAGQTSFAIGSSTATTFMVNAAGAIGIGTTTAAARIDSNGTIRVTNEPVEYRPTTGSGLEMTFLPGTPRGLVLAFDRAASAYRRLDLNDLITLSGGASANVGISDTDPDALLEVSASGGASDLFMLSSDDGNDGNRFIVKNSGNVGIGTTSPGATLATEGNILVSNTSTSTLFLSSQHGTRGGCIQLEGPASTTFRAYATTTGPLILESGACQ